MSNIACQQFVHVMLVRVPRSYLVKRMDFCEKNINTLIIGL